MKLILIVFINCVIFIGYGQGTLQVPSNHSEARSTCKNEGRLIATPLFPADKQYIRGLIQLNSTNVTLWTQVKTNLYNEIHWSKFYNIDTGQLKWTPDTIIADQCVGLVVTLYDMRLKTVSCETTLPFICSSAEATDEFEELREFNENGTDTSFHSIQSINMKSECASWCLEDESCQSFRFDSSSQDCDLYSEIPAYINTTSTQSIQILKGCADLVKPDNGMFLDPPDTMIGSNISYQCNEPYRTWNNEATSFTICETGGTWSELPTCLPVSKSCRDGWVQYEGSCYMISDESQNWDFAEQLCKHVGDHLLEIDNSAEMDGINKILHFEEDEFWTGGTDRDSEQWYRWSSQLEVMQYKNWYPGRKSTPADEINECIMLNKTLDGSEMKYFYYEVNCTDQKRYICEAGLYDVLDYGCIDHSWCNGNSICSQYYRCVCPANTYNKDGECKREFKVLNGHEIAKFDEKVPWSLASATCNRLGSNLIAPVSTDIQKAVLSMGLKSGSAVNMWTSIKDEDVIYVDYGAPAYKTIYTDNLPIHPNDKNTGSCLVMRLTRLGVQVNHKTCSSSNKFMCKFVTPSRFELVSGGVYQNKFPNTTIILNNHVECGAFCYSDRSCTYFGFSMIRKECNLYHGDNNDPLAPGIIEDTFIFKDGCEDVVDPENGVIMAGTGTGNTNGSVLTYGCNNLYKTPSQLDSTITCIDRLWSHPLNCVPDTPPCPNGWQQYSSSCYRYDSDLMTWKEAKTNCRNSNGFLVEIEDQAENDYLSRLLDFDYTKAAWTGGMDKGLEGWYRWDRFYYTEMNYTNWFTGLYNNITFPSEPSGDGVNNTDIDCIALRRKYRDVDVAEHYFSDENCENLLPSVCEIKVFSVGSSGCTPYGVYSCNGLAECVNDVCQCTPPDVYAQIGNDNKLSTYCKKILPIGSYWCSGRDDLCLNISVCTNEKCVCPSGFYQNGQDGSLATTCDIEEVACHDQWRGVGNKCYRLFDKPGIPELKPDQWCVKQKGVLASVTSQELNDIFQDMSDRTEVWLGLHGYYDTLVWSDGQPLETSNYSNWKASEDFSTIDNTLLAMSINGEWKLEQYSKLGTTQYHICEQLKGCGEPPTIPKEKRENTGQKVWDIDSTFRYKCATNYGIMGASTGVIKCLETENGGEWEGPPSCAELTATNFIHGALEFGLQISAITTDDVNNCAWNCINMNCIAFKFALGDVDCLMYSDMSAIQLPGYLNINTSSIEPVYTRNKCWPIPYVEYATHRYIMEGNSDSVEYTCSVDKVILTPYKPLIRCLDGLWEDPPVCSSRFKGNSNIVAERSKKRIVDVKTITTCHQLCLKETTFRCLAVLYIKGHCYLYDERSNDVPIIKSTELKPHSKYMELHESDLDRFTTFYNRGLNGVSYSTVDGVSMEECAQSCVNDYKKECGAFTFQKPDICNLYEYSIAQTTPIHNISTNLHLRNPECPTPYQYAGANYTFVYRKHENRISHGDVIEFTCLELDQDVIGSPNSTCQASGKWTRRQRCRNECPTGWYMEKGFCYKVYLPTQNFWQAVESCASDNSSLLSVFNQSEIDFLTKVWDVERFSPELWIGLFSNIGEWQWIEKHVGKLEALDLNISATAGLNGVTVELNTGLYNKRSVALSYGYICRKAVPAASCPSGWVELNNQCYELNSYLLSYAGAEYMCSFSGNLASPHSALDLEKFKYISDFNGVDMYLGIKREPNKDWVHSDGSKSDFLYHIGNMDNATSDIGLEQCLIFNSNNTKPVISNCTVDRQIICQTNTGNADEVTDYSGVPCTTHDFCKLGHPDYRCEGYVDGGKVYAPTCRHKDCPAPWLFRKGRCHKFSPRKMSYTVATAYCTKHGGRIMATDSLQTHYNWLDLAYEHYDHDEPLFYGYDNFTSLSQEYRSTDPRIITQPPVWKLSSVPTDSCTLLNKNLFSSGVWVSVPCSTLSHFICEKPIQDNALDVNYKGCFVTALPAWMNWPTVPDVLVSTMTYDGMTIEDCQDHCFVEGFKFGGLQGGRKCTCGNTLGHYGRDLESACDTTCLGNSSQICGGSNSMSVYATQAYPCVPGMPRNPKDPRYCYSFGFYLTEQDKAQHQCSLQGGDLAVIDDKELQQFIYQQFLLGLPFKTAYKAVHIGYWSEYIEDTASWYYTTDKHEMPWSNFLTDFHIKSKDKVYDCVRSAKEGYGVWLHECKQQAFFVCEYLDKPAFEQGKDRAFKLDIGTTATGSSKKSELIESGIIRNQVPKVFNVAEKFYTNTLDFGCINNRILCPDGFTLMMMVQINTFINSYVGYVGLLSTGNCNSLEISTETGLCIFYNANVDSIRVIYTYNNITKSAEVKAPKKFIFHQLTLMYDNQNTYLYFDGNLVGELTVSVSLIPMTKHSMKYHDVLIGDWFSDASPSDTSQVTMADIIFKPSVTTSMELQNSYGNYDFDDTVNEAVWLQNAFNPVIGYNIRMNPGAVGQGIELTDRSSVTFLNDNNRTCLHNLTSCPGVFVWMFWIQLEEELSNDYTLLTSGDVEKGISLLVKIVNSSVLEARVRSKYGEFILTHPLDLMDWTHITIFTSILRTQLYVNHSPGMMLKSPNGDTTDFSVSDTQYSPQIQLGEGKCPIGWLLHNTSCYMVNTTFGGVETHRAAAHALGGELVTIDSWLEYNWLANWLNTSYKNDAALFWIGAYDRNKETPSEWTDGTGSLIAFKPIIPNIVNINYAGFSCDDNNCFVTGITTNETAAVYELNLNQKELPLYFKCPKDMHYFQGSCYYFYSKKIWAFNRQTAMELCAKRFAKMVDIDSREEFDFVSKLARGLTDTVMIHIGLSRQELMNGSLEYVNSDLTPATFSALQDTVYDDKNCVSLSCWDDTDCFYFKELCSNLINKVLCEIPVDDKCGAGYRLWKDKCIGIVHRQDGDRTICDVSGTRPLQFGSVDDVDEIINLFADELDISSNCLTDAHKVGSSYMWKSSNTATFFNQMSLMGTGDEVGLKNSGLRKFPDVDHNCVVCEYDYDVKLNLDEVRFTSKNLMDSEIFNVGDDFDGFVTCHLPLDSINRDSFYSKCTTRSSHRQLSTASASVSVGIKPIQAVDYRHKQNVVSFGSGIIQSTDYLFTNSCVHNTWRCHHGLTVSFWLALTNNTNMTVMDTTVDGRNGITITYSEQKLLVAVYEPNHVWRSWYWYNLVDWNYVTITWYEPAGLKLYINTKLVATFEIYETILPYLHNVSTSKRFILLDSVTDSVSYMTDLYIDEAVWPENIIRKHFVSSKDDAPSHTISFDGEWSEGDVKLTSQDNLTIQWQNTFFKNVLYVDNAYASSPPVSTEKLLLNDFSQSDLCKEDYTLSFWVKPMNFEITQILLESWTNGPDNIKFLSWRLYSNLDDFSFETFIKKVKIVVKFNLNYKQWSHIVVQVKPFDKNVFLYIDGREIQGSIYKTYISTHVLNKGPFSYLDIGRRGVFYLDDIQFRYGIKNPNEMYDLRSCTDYLQIHRGYYGIQNKMISDGAGTFHTETCDFDTLKSGLVGIKFDMESGMFAKLNGIFLQTTIQIEYVNSMNGRAVKLPWTGIKLHGLPTECLTDFTECRFGYSVAMWLYLSQTSAKPLTLHQITDGQSTSVQVICNTDLSCEATVKYGHTKWVTSFSLPVKKWTHLAVTWNMYQGIKLYVNAFNIEKFGITTIKTVEATNVAGTKTGVQFGTSAGEVNDWLMDDMVLVQHDLSDDEVKKVFGQSQVCQNDWKYNDQTDLCYKSFSSQMQFTDAQNLCLAEGGTLLIESSEDLHNWIQENITTADDINSNIWVDMKQFQAVGRYYWLDGTLENYTSIITIPPDGSRFCGSLSAPNSILTASICSDLAAVICQVKSFDTPRKELSAVASTQYHNYTTIQSPLASPVPGLIGEALQFPNNMSSYRLSYECLNDLELCHNGFSFMAWLCLKPSGTEEETIISTQANRSAPGFTLSGSMVNGVYVLRLTVQSCHRGHKIDFYITTFEWTHLYVSIYKEEINIYLNGRLYQHSNITIADPSDYCLGFGEVVPISLGKRPDGSNPMNGMIDEIHLFEHKMLKEDILLATVSNDLPIRFDQGFEDLESFRHAVDAEVIKGHFGHAVYFNGSSKSHVEQEGQLVLDCLGSLEVCRNGFTTAVWIKPDADQSAFTFDVMSIMNEQQGIRIYHEAGQGYKVDIRNTSLEYLLPFELVPHMWSYVLVTWRESRPYLYVNGISEDAMTIQQLSTTEHSTIVIRFGHEQDSVPGEEGFRGAVDDFTFIRYSVTDERAWQMYWKVLFVENPIKWDFETVDPVYLGTPGIDVSCTGLFGNCIRIDDKNKWLNLSSDIGEKFCYLIKDSCVHGFTISFMFKFEEERDSDQTILTTGGDNPEGLGVYLKFAPKNESLGFRRYFNAGLRMTDFEYSGWFNLEHNVWESIVFTWYPKFGFRVFIGGLLVVEDKNGVNRTSTLTTLKQDLLIGRSSDGVDDHEAVFELDELNLWDKALENNIQSVEVEEWFHFVLQTAASPASAHLPLMYQEECTDRCKEDATHSCESFTYCPLPVRGDCYLNQQNGVSMLNSTTDCDTYKKLSFEHRDYAIPGCYGDGFIESGIFASLPIECRRQCYPSFKYTGIRNGSICLCGENISMSSSLPSSDCNIPCEHSNVMCGGSNSISVFTTTFVEDYVTPKNPIVDFNVTLTPGIDLIIGQTLILNYTVNYDTSAGFKIETSFNPNPIFTNQNSTSLYLNQSGSVDIVVTAMNEISQIESHHQVMVVGYIDAVLFPSKLLGLPNQNIDINVTIVGGTHAECFMDFGDGQNESVSQFESDEMVIFSHIYTYDSVFPLVLTCENKVSGAQNSSAVIIQEEITGLTLFCNDVYHYPNDIAISWNISSGSVVSYSLYIGGKEVANMSTSAWASIPLSSYSRTGQHEVELHAKNLVSQMIIKRSVNIEIPISYIVVTTDDPYFEPGQNVEFDVYVHEGSSINFTINYMDGTEVRASVSENCSDKDYYFNHTYNTVGTFNVSVVASNIISSTENYTQVIIQEPVPEVTVTIYNTTGPGVPFEIILEIPLSHKFPTDPVCTIDFDDGTDPVNLTWVKDPSQRFNYNHNYKMDGLFDVKVTVWNLVSSYSEMFTVMVGQAINSLHVSTDSTNGVIATDNILTVNADVNLGSHITYVYDFDDGTIITHDYYLASPNAMDMCSHVYQIPGTYQITVQAWNYFSNVTKTLLIEVQQGVGKIGVYFKSPVRVNKTAEFVLFFDKPPSKACSVWSFGDGTRLLVGDTECPNNPGHMGIPFQQASGAIITVNHMYTSEADFNLDVITNNDISSDTAYHSISVKQFMCIQPDVSILGFPNEINKRLKIGKTQQSVILANVVSECDPPVDVVYTWSVEQIDLKGSTTGVVAPPESISPSLIFPENYLNYGIHKVSLTVAYVGTSNNTNTIHSVYFEIVPTDLIVKIDGDDYITASHDSILRLDASRSYDADQTHGDLQFKWYCRLINETFPKTKAIMKTSKIVDTSSPGCLGNGVGLLSGADNSVITFPAKSFVPDQEYVFMVEVSKDIRLMFTEQTVKITNKPSHHIVMSCEDNCGVKTSDDLPIRFRSNCLSCTNEEKHLLSYSWQLFLVRPDESLTEQLDLENHTATGVNSPSLMIKSHYLTEGQDYRLRLSAGKDSITERSITVNYPPYNGKCNSNANAGIAFSSGFSISCSGWLDEEDRPQRNPAVDSTKNNLLTYKLLYQVQGSHSGAHIFYTVTGDNITTPQFTLRQGRPEHGYHVNVFIYIEDKYQSYQEAVVHLKIVPDDKELMGLYSETEYQDFVAKKDMTAILLMNMGITELISEEEGNPNSTKDIPNAKEQIIHQISNHVDWVDTPEQVELLTDLLLHISEEPASLTLHTQKMLEKIYARIIPKLNQIFNHSKHTTQTNTVGEGITKGYLQLVIAQKLHTPCFTDCNERKYLTEKILAGYKDRYELISMILSGSVPGEVSPAIHIGDYINYVVARHDADSIPGADLYIGNNHLATIPSSVNNYIDLSQYSNLDIEVIEGVHLSSTKTDERITSRTTSLVVYGDGRILDVFGLLEPVKVKVMLDPAVRDQVQRTALSTNDTEKLKYIKVQLGKPEMVTNVEFIPSYEFGLFDYYIKTDSLPTEIDYELKGTIGPKSWMIRLSVDMFDKGYGIDTYRLGGVDAYIGIKPKFDTNKHSPEVDVRIYSAGCYYWNIKHNVWSKKGVQHSAGTSVDSVECLTNHLTDFGASFFVPPNTINFSTVFDKFKDIGDNAAVLSVVISLIILYCIIVFIVRRSDRKDVMKWSVEPLSDNIDTDIYHYQVTIYTGIRRNAGTKSNIFMVLAGFDDESEIRALKDDKNREFSTGSVNSYLMSVPRSLGDLTYLRIWHDSTGKTKMSDWYLNLVVVKDIQNGASYVFLCDRWLSLTKDDGQTERFIPVASKEDLQNFAHLFFFKSRKDITDGHLWLSVISRPTRSPFTRVQRLSCCLSLLFTTMIANAMWYQTTEGLDYSQNASVGPFTFSAQELLISLFGSFIVVPVNILIVTLFRKSAPAKQKEPSLKIHPKVTVNDTLGKEDTIISNCNDDPFESLTNKKKTFQLPHWCVYIAWVLVFLSVIVSGFFTILYSQEWGAERSGMWLSAFFLSFLESVILVQPMKVIAVAIVVAVIFKSTSEYEDGKESELEVYDIVKTGKQRTIDPATPAYPVHRKPYTDRNVDVESLEKLREYRKKQSRLFGVFQEIIVYSFYVIIIAILCYESKDTTGYCEVNGIRNLFIKNLDSPNSMKGHRGLEGISNYENFWDWCGERLLPNLYRRDYYNKDEVSRNQQLLLADGIHFRVGLPQLRQARVKTETCEVNPHLIRTVGDCLDGYGLSTYNDVSYEVGWKETFKNTTLDKVPWQYKGTLEVNGFPITGDRATYGGGGYTAVLEDNFAESEDIILYLKSQRWLDRQTRAVFVEVNLYNPGVNMFTIVNMMLEFPPTGGVSTKAFITPLRLYRYVGPSAIFVILLDLLFVAFTMYYLIQQCRQLKKIGMTYFKEFWNCIEFMNTISAVLCCAFYGVHYMFTEMTLSDFYDNAAQFVNFQRIVLWDDIFCFIQAFLLFFSMLKLLRLVRFNSKVTQLAGTLRRSVWPLFNFCIVFIIIFVAFTACGYIVFGSQNAEYSTFFTTTQTLFSMLLMKVNIDPLIATNQFLGPLFVFIYILMVVFILINMFMSILNDTFTAVRCDKSCLPDDPAMVNFMINEFKRLIGASDTYDYNKSKENLKKTDNKSKIKLEEATPTYQFLTSVYTHFKSEKTYNPKSEKTYKPNPDAF